MAYKIQLGPANLDGAVSGASTIRAVGSVSSSGDLAVTGAVHAATLFGNGSGLTNISADGIDVTSSTGDIAYNLVFTQGFQTDGTLGLGGNTALSFNPSDALLSSSAGAGFKGSISSSGDLAVTGNAHAAFYYGNGSNLTGIDSVSGSERQYSSTGMETSGYLKVSGSVTFAGTGSLSSINMTGSLSGSGQLLFRGPAQLGNTLDVTGAISGANLSGEAGTLTSLNLQVGGITNAGALAGVTTATLSGKLSSSAGTVVMGNTVLGGQLAVSGGAQYQVTTVTSNGHLTASNATMYQVVSGGTATITMILPSASAGANYQYAIKRHGLMSGNVVITGSDRSDVIDGNSSLTLETPGASVFLISDGTQWNIF